jgi:hypothetical protein
MSKECILSILKKTEQSDSTLRHSAVRYSIFDTAELVAGCGLLVLKSIKRSVINIRRSMFDVLTYSPFRPGGVSYKRRRWPEKRRV